MKEDKDKHEEIPVEDFDNDSADKDCYEEFCSKFRTGRPVETEIKKGHEKWL